MRPKELKDTDNRLHKQRQAREPSGPRHMTTRRTASKPTSVASPSVTGSVASNESRRDSLSEITLKVGGSDADAERPAKVARLSNEPYQSSQTRLPGGEWQEEKSGSQGEISILNEDEILDADLRHQGPSATQDSSYQDDSEAPKVSIEISKAEDVEEDDDDEDGSEPARTNENGRSVSPMEEPHEDAEDLHGAEAVSIAHDSGDNQSPEKQEPGGLLKRLPGRRRAPHADPGVEADLRRQLELKVAYRAVAKALKPLLAELARRTAESLESNTEHHKEHEEYNEVILELDSRLQQRLSVINFWRQEEESRLQRIREAEEEIVRNRFASKFRDLRDDRILECKHHFLSIIRDLEVQEDGDATEDEDGIIPRLYRIKYPEVVRTPLADAFDSRSRVFVQTRKLWDDFEHRHAFREDQREFDANSLVICPKDFAVYDGEQRAHAIASLNVNLLANAGKDIEDAAVRAKRQASNAAAVGLHALADASDMAVISPSTDVEQNKTMSVAPQTPRSNKKTPADMIPRLNGTISPSPRKRSSGKPRQPVLRFGGTPQATHSTSPVTQAATFANPSNTSRGPELRPLMPLAAKPADGGDESFTNRSSVQESRSITPPHPEAPKNGFSVHVEHRNTDLPLQFPSPPIEHRQTYPMGQRHENLSREDGNQGKPRKRPGPRAHYSTAEEPSQPTNHPIHDYWRPFNNSMGPPMFTPPYVGGSENGRKASFPGPLPSTNPGVNDPDRATNHKRNDSIGTQLQPSILGRRSSGDHRSAEVTSVERESHTPTAPLPPSFLQPGHQSPFMKQWNPPQPFFQPNSYYGPFHGQLPGLPPPPQYVSRSPSSSGLHSASAFPPPSPYSFPGPPPPPLRHNLIPSHPFQPLPPQFSPTPTTSGGPPPPPSVGQPYPPYPPPPSHIQHPSNSVPQPQINMKHPGQVGHTPILPATLDPNRNRPPSTTPTASSPPPFHPSGGGSMGVFSLYSPPTQNQETPLTPYEQHRPPGPREPREKHPSRQQEHIFYSMPSATTPARSTTPVTLGHHHHRHHSQADAHGFVHHSPWARPNSQQNKRRGSTSSGLTAGAKRDGREGSAPKFAAAAGKDTLGVSPASGVGTSRLSAGTSPGEEVPGNGTIQKYSQDQPREQLQSQYETQDQAQSRWQPPPPEQSQPQEQPQEQASQS